MKTGATGCIALFCFTLPPEVAKARHSEILHIRALIDQGRQVRKLNILISDANVQYWI